MLAAGEIDVDGSFLLSLTAKYNLTLSTLGSQFLEMIPDGVSCSNPDVKIGSPVLTLYKDDGEVGIVDYGYYSETKTEEGAMSEYAIGGFVYADSPCDIKGSFVEKDDETGVYTNIIFDISFKKGWNCAFVNNGDKRALRRLSCESLHDNHYRNPRRGHFHLSVHIFRTPRIRCFSRNSFCRKKKIGAEALSGGCRVDFRRVKTDIRRQDAIRAHP